MKTTNEQYTGIVTNLKRSDRCDSEREGGREMSDRPAPEYDTVPSDFARHDCAVQPTMNLRWKVGPYYPMLQDSRKLEQAFICCVCGKYEWREVLEVKEGAK